MTGVVGSPALSWWVWPRVPLPAPVGTPAGTPRPPAGALVNAILRVERFLELPDSKEHHLPFSGQQLLDDRALATGVVSATVWVLLGEVLFLLLVRSTCLRTPAQ